MHKPIHASFFRRFAALIYDSFIVFSFLLLLTTFALLANQGRSLHSLKLYFLLYLMFFTGLFLSWFWSRKGQTLGMLAWKLKVVDTAYNDLSWGHAFLRYWISLLTLSCGGIGLLWCLVDKDKQSLHDR